MKRPTLILTTLFLAIGVLTFVKIAVSNRISTNGVVLGEVQEKIDKYQTENTILKEKILSLSSLSALSQKATKMGFVEEKNAFVINSPVPIAFKQ